MPYLLNALYGLAAVALFPWLLVRSLMTGRYRRGMNAKLFGLASPPASGKKPVAWFHGVSLGEVQLLRTVVAAFRLRHPDWECVVSATTDTGLAEARKCFADLAVIDYPFDFSWAVRRTLAAVNPRLIVLAESELWPNFLRAAGLRNIPVVVVNGRTSPRSFGRYRKFAWLARPLLFGRVTHFAMQTGDYAESMQRLGIASEKVSVTGSMKYDGALGDRRNARTLELRRLLALTDADRVWVAGSTHAPEEKLVLDAFRRLRVTHPELRLILVPRSPDRFDDVAKLMDRNSFSYVRRTQIAGPLRDKPAVILVDTIGELGAAWGLADVGFVGGSLDGRRGGQSMIEPASYGVPVLFGPHVWNFRDAAARLVEAGGGVQVKADRGLEHEVQRLIDDPDLQRQMGDAARELVRTQQGATARTLDVIDGVLGARSTSADPLAA
jgi:3-deoxy-D-manno-octulosonic-acid transferase